MTSLRLRPSISLMEIIYIVTDIWREEIRNGLCMFDDKLTKKLKKRYRIEGCKYLVYVESGYDPRWFLEFILREET